MILHRQDTVLTATVGSYPKPTYIYPNDGRALLDSFGISFGRLRQEVGAAKFDKLLNKAALEAINDQDDAGIDIISDGEERRGHYVIDVVKKLDGIDMHRLKLITFRGDTDTQMSPSVTGKIRYREPVVLDEFLFAQQHAKGIIKISLPGPTTVVDSLADEYYRGDRKRLAFDYAAAIRHETEALVKSGCRIIQIDDPVLLRHPEEAKEWGLDALEQCFEGLEHKATFAVHICRGYPNKPFEAKGIDYKADQLYYRDILTWLSDSKLDIVSIEGAQGNLDLSVLSAAGDKTIMLGVLDVGVNEVETIEALQSRGSEALRYIPKSQLIMAPDCGMIELTRESSRRKLNNLSLAAARLNLQTANAPTRK